MRPISFHYRFIFCFLFSLMVFASEESFARKNSFFYMDETENNSLTPFPKWTGMMDRFGNQEEQNISDCGKIRYFPCVIIKWKNFVLGLEGRSLKTKLNEINNWSNAHPYITDQLNWGMIDFWETPFEFMEMNGDCEDYAISKYYSLRAAGVPAEQMRVMVVQDFNLGGIIHAVLGVYDGDELWILDNQIKQVRSAYSIYHYRPIYGVNENRWWRYHPYN